MITLVNQAKAAVSKLTLDEQIALGMFSETVIGAFLVLNVLFFQELVLVGKSGTSNVWAVRVFVTAFS